MTNSWTSYKMTNSDVQHVISSIEGGQPYRVDDREISYGTKTCKSCMTDSGAYYVRGVASDYSTDMTELPKHDLTALLLNVNRSSVMAI